MSSRWEVHSEKPLYTDEWLDIRLADVELPDGRHLEHRLIRTRPGAGVAMIVEGSVLLLWRHRFITGTWGWEVPLGKADPGEDPLAAAAREAEEETGWRPGPLRPLLRIEPTPGISDSVHHVFRADTATHIGPPPDAYESDRIAWVPLADIPRLAADGKISSGTTLSALLYALTQHPAWLSPNERWPVASPHIAPRQATRTGHRACSCPPSSSSRWWSPPWAASARR